MVADRPFVEDPRSLSSPMVTSFFLRPRFFGVVGPIFDSFSSLFRDRAEHVDDALLLGRAWNLLLTVGVRSGFLQFEDDAS